MKKKKFIIILTLIIILIIIYIFFSYYYPKYYVKRVISDNTKLKISNASIISESSNKGWFGDGSYIVSVDCSKNKKVLKQIKRLKWNKLPLPEIVQVALYGGKFIENSGKEIIFIGNKDVSQIIPKVKNGYWYFLDRSDDVVNKNDYSDVYKRASMNYSIAIYNLDNDVLYYFEDNT